MAPSAVPHDAPHWVYRLVDIHNEIVYVGFTGLPEKRLTQHKAATWGPHLRLIVWQKCSSKKAAMALERETIRRFRPRYNVAHNLRHHRRYVDHEETARLRTQTRILAAVG